MQLADDVGYTGHQDDVATGLTYMQARYYDPVVGRFMAVDPVQFSGANVGYFGRYTYVHNNPFRYTDPTGTSAGKAASSKSNTRCDEDPNCTVYGGRHRNADSADEAIDDALLDECRRVGCDIEYLRPTDDPLSVGFLTDYMIVFGNFGGLGPRLSAPRIRVPNSALGSLGRAGNNKGIREVVGDAGDARKLFDRLRGGNAVKEVKPGVYVAKGRSGGNVTYRETSKSGPPTIDVHGIEEGVRKIKFVKE